jgi:predicted DNA-binding transcriptional regulator AlpA
LACLSRPARKSGLKPKIASSVLAGWKGCGQQYAQQGKVARGLLRRYIVKMTGLSRAQVTRLIARYTASGRIQVTVYRRRRFSQLYIRADIELLASVDEAHETLSGPATRRILEREHLLSKRPEYARLAGISVAHLYNLCKSQRYRERLLNYTRTRPTAVSIDERRKPQAGGPARPSASGHGASGRWSRGQGRLSNRCRRRGHAMAGRRRDAAHLGIFPAIDAGIGTC